MFCVLEAKFNFGVSSNIIVSDSTIAEAKVPDIDTRVYLPGFQVNTIIMYA